MISSVVERFVHIEDVGGSNPSSPTILPRRSARLYDDSSGSMNLGVLVNCGMSAASRMLSGAKRACPPAPCHLIHGAGFHGTLPFALVVRGQIRWRDRAAHLSRRSSRSRRLEGFSSLASAFRTKDVLLCRSHPHRTKLPSECSCQMTGSRGCGLSRFKLDADLA